MPHERLLRLHGHEDPITKVFENWYVYHSYMIKGQFRHAYQGAMIATECSSVVVRVRYYLDLENVNAKLLFLCG